ncbi:hypothetical protein [uncultured Bdellovibrio sp.]|uniref:hypothetical protein n=1 Tax=Bdellovibrio sp. HCB-162 TaxID=3394234 RepID=UPI0025E89E05|nr:hypothetical protein [uncultured Bdellovibrio sp.]
MKTLNLVSKIFKALSLVAITLLLANCSKDNKSSTTVGAYQLVNGICYQNVNGQLVQQSNTALCNNAGGYQLINGMCYQNVNGQLIQQANTSLCTSSTGSYQLVNGVCYQNINGQLIQQANTSLCYNNGGYNNGGYQTMVCTGAYTDGYQIAQCGTQFNCSGYTLMNVQTGQIVRCQ